MSDISLIYQYIGDISSTLSDFFLFFQETTFICKKSYRDGPTPEISTIYHRYFATFLTLLMGECTETLEVHLMVVKEEVESKDLVEA